MSAAPNFFVPNQLTILAITQSNPMFIFTFGNHGLNTGAVIRILIPKSRGMQQLNNMVIEVAAGAADVLGFFLDSTNFDPYITLAPPDPTFHSEVGQILVIAEDALTLDYAIHNNNNIIPETFGPVPNNPRVTL